MLGYMMDWVILLLGVEYFFFVCMSLSFLCNIVGRRENEKKEKKNVIGKYFDDISK